jgi:argininosuccinate lyase
LKLWQKENTVTSEKIERFTVGRDRELDVHLAEFDVLGNLAHATMLQTIDLLTADELADLKTELKAIYQQIQRGEFVIEEGVEDVHSQVELMLTRKLGDTGKKIHSGRSRNDQVLVDLKLYVRDRLTQVVQATEKLFDVLNARAEQHKDDLLPGYAFLLRPVVWSLRRRTHRRRGAAQRGLPPCQPQPAGLGGGLRLVVSAQPHPNHRTAGL